MFQWYGLKSTLITGIDCLLDMQEGGYVGLG